METANVYKDIVARTGAIFTLAWWGGAHRQEPL